MTQTSRLLYYGIFETDSDTFTLVPSGRGYIVKEVRRSTDPSFFEHGSDGWDVSEKSISFVDRIKELQIRPDPSHPFNPR